MSPATEEDGVATVCSVAHLAGGGRGDRPKGISPADVSNVRLVELARGSQHR